jgi:hypothetical protein
LVLKLVVLCASGGIIEQCSLHNCAAAHSAAAKNNRLPYTTTLQLSLIRKTLLMKQHNDLYMLPIGDPHIEANREVFEMMALPENNTLRMQVSVEDVETGHVGSIQVLLMSLQHYPHLIEKMLFSLEFDCIEDEKTEMVLPPDVWKMEPVFYTWFHRLMNTPFAIFFIADEDARFYALYGDMLASGEIVVEVDEPSGKTYIVPNEAQAKIIGERVVGACLNMLHFCHYSGFDPRIYIEAMMASNDLEFSYEALLEDYEHFVNNAHFRIVEE